MFSVNFKLKVMRNLINVLRKDISRSYVFALIKPLSIFHQDVLRFRQKTIFFLTHTGVKMSLEHLLNKLFPGANSGIYIETVEMINPGVVFFLSENQPAKHVYFHSEPSPPAHVRYFLSEINQMNAYQFIVYVPDFLVFDENRMKSFINKYALTGMQYKIEIYS